MNTTASKFTSMFSVSRGVWMFFMLSVVAPGIIYGAEFYGLSFTAEGYYAIQDSMAQYIPAMLATIWAFPVYLVASLMPEGISYLVIACGMLNEVLTIPLVLFLCFIVLPPFYRQGPTLNSVTE